MPQLHVDGSVREPFHEVAPTSSTPEEELLPHQRESRHGQNPVIIGFDLHHVLARPRKVDMIKSVFSTTSWREKFWFSLYAVNPFFWWEISRLARERLVPERITAGVIQSYPHLSHLRLDNLVREFCNCQDPHLDTWNLVYQLRQEGHVLCITSNITTNYLIHLREQWSSRSVEWQTQSKYEHLPEDLFSLFDFCFTSDEVDDFQRKPSVNYFDRWLKEIEERHPETSPTVYFVDDSAHNVTVARGTGQVESFHYRNTQDLYWDLQQRDLLP